MSEQLSDYEKILTRMERLEKGLSLKVQSFVDSQQALEQCKEELVMEIEEIRALKTILIEATVNAIKDNSEALVPQLLPAIVSGFEEKTHALMESSFKNAEQLKEDVSQTISQAKKMISTQSKAITRNKIALNIAICSSVMLTALGLFYFFPQNVNYGLHSSMASAIVLGETIMDNSDQLTPAQREYFLKKAAEKLRVRNGYK